ncbi:MAG: putative tail fiber protein [Prokaryotic dsDNA virus sp.]|nr:MAG: putative tail fiber protein [Prokaryotic dsDNA virus sp.]|tara:strand:- start:6140 stop:9025 length:2886 start_codon:yes stop_codon:yes gene_type:complete
MVAFLFVEQRYTKAGRVSYQSLNDLLLSGLSYDDVDEKEIVGISGGRHFEVAPPGTITFDETIANTDVRLWEYGNLFSSLDRFVSAVARGNPYEVGDTVLVDGVIYRFDDDGNTDIAGLTGWVKTSLTQAEVEAEQRIQEFDTWSDANLAVINDKVKTLALRGGEAPADGQGGTWVLDPSDTDSSHNPPEVIVSANGRRFKPLSLIYKDAASLLASSIPDGALPDDTIIRTRAEGFAYRVVSSGEHITTAGGLKLQYEPDEEVNVLALRTAADGVDINVTLARAVQNFPGHVIRLPPGNYTASTSLEIGGADSCFIRADGAHITVDEDVYFLRAEDPAWEAVQSLTSSITAGDYWGGRKTISVTDGTAYAVGDLVKIVSDDKMESTRAGDGTNDYRMGFMGFIESISGNDVILDRPVPIEWSFTTNPRIARMPRRHYQWKGGVIGYEEGHDSVWTGNAMIFSGVSDLDVDVEIEKTYNAAIRPLGCFEPRIRALGRDLQNDQFNGNYGYLVGDGSQGANVHVVAGRNRHGYTTSHSLIPANSSDITAYGPACFALVSGQSHGNTQAGFDTHHGSAYITFSDCFVSGGTAGGGQFVARGVGHRLNNCRGINGKNGIYAYTEDGAGRTRDIRANGCEIDVDDKAFRAVGADLEISGGTYRARKYGQMARVVDGASLTLKGHITMRPGGPAEVDNKRMIETVDSEIDARGAQINVDLSDIPSGATEYGVIELGGGTGSSLNGGTWRLMDDDDVLSFLYRAGAGSHSAGEGLRLVTQKLGDNPGSSMQITGAASQLYNSRWSWEHAGGDGGTEFILRNITSDGYEIPLHERDDPVIFAKLFSDIDRTLGALPASAPVGQRLTILNADASYTITVKHGALYNVELANAADLVLSHRDTVTLCFDGSVWWQVAERPDINLQSYTVATLPSVSPAGQMIYVTDETGGAIPAFSDGTDWRRVTDRAIVS